MNMEKLQHAIELGAKWLDKTDLEFYQRVWGTDLNVYRSRLKAIQFDGLGNVLDAGSGMGQWTWCLAELNQHVCALDVSPARIKATQFLFRELDVTNAEVSQGSVEELSYTDNCFDAIFCYSTIMMTDYRKTLREFYRVLKPGGKVYICANGLGWYVYNLIEPHNQSSNYDPRQMAIDTLLDTLLFFTEEQYIPSEQLILPSRLLQRALGTIGFEPILVGGEGTLRLDDSVSAQSFYPAQHYQLENVYEVLAWKK